MNFQKTTSPTNYSNLYGTLNAFLSVQYFVISKTQVLDSGKIASSDFFIITEIIRT